MERKKGSFALNEAGTFTGRFTAFSVNSACIVSALVDNRKSRESLAYHISNSRNELKPGSIIVCRDAAVFTSITIQSGTIDIIF